MGGVRFVVGWVEECGGRGKVCGGRVEGCGERGEVCGGRRKGVWWEGEVCRSSEGMWDRSTGYREQVGGVRCVVREVEGCGRVGGMCVGGRGVWWEE